MAEATPDELARQGWDALSRGRWDDARSYLEEACELDESAKALDGLGRALHFQGEYARAIELTERAFAAYRAAERRVDAADCARWLAFQHGVVNANMAAASGWMARAETLLAGADECAGHGWLALDRAPFTDDAAERERLARRRFRSPAASATSTSSTTRSPCWARPTSHRAASRRG